jgi:putative tricarboxylic transport membrane protein
MLESLEMIFSGYTLLYMFFGVVLGVIFGAIPGLTATLAVVLLVPFTYSMDVTNGMATLIGVYVGGISGGVVSAIMLKMPGTPSSVATTFDGFPLARQGKAGKALGVAVTSSFVGTIFSWLVLIFLAPYLAKVALAFGPFEYVGAILFGFTAVITLSGDSIYKGVISAALGLGLVLIGTDSLTGMPRATFGSEFLISGFPYMPALIGLFVLAEIFSQIEAIDEKFVVPSQKITGVYMTVKELIVSIPNFIRSSLIGVAIGILPGIGGSFANFVAYDQARKASKDPDSFGKGNIQGIVASETGNNATIGGSLIPLVSLGIPGDIVTAALLGGLMIKGITPGPLFATEYPHVLYAIFNSVLLSSFLMLAFMLFIGVRVMPPLLRMPKHVLLPIVLIMSLAGAYNINFSVNDVWIAVFMGIIGYIMDKLKYPKTPIVITMILGKAFELQLRTALMQSDGSLLPMLTRPYALIFVMITVLSIAIPIIGKMRQAAKAKAA